MHSTEAFSRHVQQMYFGGNWTEVNLKDTLSNITLEHAIKKIDGFNTILALTYHIHYFTKVQLRVLEDGILDGKDSESYNHPPINSHDEWDAFCKSIWQDAERLIALGSELSDSILNKPYVNVAYGTYSSNFLGLIEHSHYHLGQIVILKKRLEKT